MGIEQSYQIGSQIPEPFPEPLYNSQINVDTLRVYFVTHFIKRLFWLSTSISDPHDMVTKGLKPVKEAIKAQLCTGPA